MEQIRLIVAVILSILVFLVWDYFFIPDTPPQPAPQQLAKEEQTVQTPAESPHEEKLPPSQPLSDSEKTPIKPPKPAVDESPLPATLVETPLYSAELAGRQACLTRFNLKKYREEKREESSFKHLIADENTRGTGCVDISLKDIPETENTGFYPSKDTPGPIKVIDSPRTLSYTRAINAFVSIEKRYTFFPDSYAVDLDVIIKNRSDAPLTGNLGVSLNRYFSGKESRFVFEGPCAYKNGKLEEVKLHKIKETPAVSGRLSWIAIQSRYFMSAVIPAQQQDEAVMALTNGDDGMVTAQYRQTLPPVSPQAMATFHYTIYMGPKDIDILKSIGSNLDRAVYFGMFDFIARPCLWLMKHIYQIIPNYGISIILVTLIIKLLFWPLGTKSYKSMGEMKKIQPLMAEIREKYKNDKKKMNEEMMGLYKTYKVNPLGGCLPMLVQIPVFIAFYRMLYQAIELRHAPFFLWINDLSAPERLFSFDVSIPLMQPPTGIPVLTIIMGATMFLQQKMQPSPGDPAQAKMMLLMPIFLTVIFINFPSGLVLYFIVNNLFSIFQQHYVTRRKS
jgi:YidC/Oxa1 family membrane protein insertase